MKAENFTIEGASVTSATLSEDKKKATLEVAGLDYDKKYTVDVKGVLVNGTATDLGSKEFKAPAVADLWELQISSKESTLMANGSDNTEVTFKLINKATGQVDKDADNMVLDLNTTYGTLASKRVTIQDGQATVLLTSEFSNTNITAKIDAQIIEASGDYKALIGKVVGTTAVSFTTATTENVETVTLVSAEANQADRLTLFFDKNVSLKHFVATNSKGELLYEKQTAPGVWTKGYTADQLVNVDANDIRHQLKLANSVVIKQGSNSNFAVKGFKPVAGNSKAMEVIVEKTTALKDNASVDVEVNTVNSLDKETKSSVEFKVTDARKPEATSVKAEGLNTLKVKFSEAIADATFQIDGRFVSPSHFTYKFGEFNPATLVDNRDLATIELVKGAGGKTVDNPNAGYDEDGIADTDAANKTLSGYFTAGQHALQIASTQDFAYSTDKTNIGSTQNLTFNIAEDKGQPTATVTVESPEQFRLKFDKAIGLSSADFEKLITDNVAATGKPAVRLQVQDANGNYVDASGLTSGKGQVLPSEIKVTKVTDSEYVLELNKDWTVIHTTSTENKNYYNYKYRIAVDKNTVTNVANGMKNNELSLDLSYSGSPLTAPDVTSPTINTIERLSATSTQFDVTMSEPVKLVVGGTEKDLSTRAETQGTLQNTTAQFIGKDKDGKTVTIDAVVNNYADKDSADKVVRLGWYLGKDAGGNLTDDPTKVATPIVTPQSVVDAGGSTEWTLVVRALGDDVGNTVASATKTFTITKSAATNSPFLVEKYPTGDPKAGKHKVEGFSTVSGSDNRDKVEITFTEGVQFSGLSDATNPAQYTLNGNTLPTGTSISIADTDSDPKNGFDKVIITLPDGTLNLGAKVSNVVTINKNLVSYDGSKLEGATEIVVNMDENNQAAADLTTAQAVIDTINTLPATIALADKPAVTAARAAFTGLTAAQQALVTNITKLTSAETAIADLEAVAAAKTAVEGAAYADIQANIADEAAALAKIKATIDALDLKGASYVVTKVSYNAAVAGDGTGAGAVNGSYKFTVKLTKGAAVQTTVQKDLVITATP